MFDAESCKKKTRDERREITGPTALTGTYPSLGEENGEKRKTDFEFCILNSPNDTNASNGPNNQPTLSPTTDSNGRSS